MAKVELENIRLAVTAITKSVVASIPNKAGTIMLHKHDVTGDFLRCIIDYGANTIWDITTEAGADAYQVACVKKEVHKKALYSRKEVIKLLSQAVKDNVGEDISLEQWAKKKML